MNMKNRNKEILKRITSFTLAFIIMLGVFAVIPIAEYTVKAEPQAKIVDGFLAPIAPVSAGSIPISNRAELESIRNNL